MNGSVLAGDAGRSSVHVHLDLCAAFNTTDRSIYPNLHERWLDLTWSVSPPPGIEFYSSSYSLRVLNVMKHFGGDLEVSFEEPSLFSILLH